MFSKNLKKVFVVQSLIHVQLFGNPWTAAYQASLSFTISQSLLKFMSKAQTHEFAQSLLKLMSQFRGRGGSPRGLWAVLMPNSWGRQKETLSFIFLGLLRSFSSSQSLWSLLRESNESLLLGYMWSNRLPPLPERSHCPSATLPLLSLLLPPLPLPVSPPHPMLSSPLHGPIHKLQKHRWVDLPGILICCAEVFCSIFDTDSCELIEG